LQINRLKKQTAEKHLDLEVTEAAIDEIARQGYDPSYGARPLKRVIQQQVQNPLATELLKRNLADGGHVKVDCQDGEFAFEWLDAAAEETAAV
jgi:ATP-dependent Clp protease ATP-binding subunit ClpB